MNARLVLVALALCVVVPDAARAQDAQQARNGAVRDTIQRLADSVRSAGLPVEPLFAKAAEGELKGADDARILRAVRSLARELGDARPALPASASTGTIVAGASALHAGVAVDDIRRVVAGSSRAADGELALALVTLADLVANKVSPATAVPAISSLLARHASDVDMNALRMGVARDVEAGRAPTESLRTRAQGIVDRLDGRVAGAPMPAIKPPQ